MATENSVQHTINPEVPKILSNEQINVYVPIATENKPGVASFYGSHFAVDDYGNVQINRDILAIFGTGTIAVPDDLLVGESGLIGLSNSNYRNLHRHLSRFVDGDTLSLDVDPHHTQHYVLSSFETHNEDESAHPFIRGKINSVETDLTSYKAQVENRFTSEIRTINQAAATETQRVNNAMSAESTRVNNKIATDIGTHNSDESAHPYIQDAINLNKASIEALKNRESGKSTNYTVDSWETLKSAIREPLESYLNNKTVALSDLVTGDKIIVLEAERPDFIVVRYSDYPNIEPDQYGAVYLRYKNDDVILGYLLISGVGLTNIVDGGMVETIIGDRGFSSVTGGYAIALGGTVDLPARAGNHSIILGSGSAGHGSLLLNGVEGATSHASEHSIALGYKNVAQQYSIIVGRRNEKFRNSFIMGDDNVSEYTERHFVVGNRNEIVTNDSFTFGNDNYIAASYDFTIGQNITGNSDSSGYNFRYGSNISDVGTIGQHNFMFGNNIYSGGDYGFNFGHQNTIDMLVRYGIAFGSYNEVITNYGVTIGNGNQAGNEYAIAVGNLVEATGSYSMGVGSGIEINGSHSFVFGSNISSNPSNTLSFGTKLSTGANGQYGITFGYNNSNGVKYGIVQGKDNSSYGSYSMVLGQAYEAVTDYSYLIGRDSTVTALYSLASLNSSNVNAIYSLVIGSNISINNYNYSDVIGKGLTVQNDYAHIHGQYNSPSTYLFTDDVMSSELYYAFGNGEDTSSRKNLFEIGSGVSVEYESQCKFFGLGTVSNSDTWSNDYRDLSFNVLLNESYPYNSYVQFGRSRMYSWAFDKLVLFLSKYNDTNFDFDSGEFTVDAFNYGSNNFVNGRHSAAIGSGLRTNSPYEFVTGHYNEVTPGKGYFAIGGGDDFTGRYSPFTIWSPKNSTDVNMLLYSKYDTNKTFNFLVHLPDVHDTEAPPYIEFCGNRLDASTFRTLTSGINYDKLRQFLSHEIDYEELRQFLSRLYLQSNNNGFRYGVGSTVATNTDGKYSFSFGEQLSIQNQYQFNVGVFNESTPGRAYFTVGQGSSAMATRKYNPFAIYGCKHGYYDVTLQLKSRDGTGNDKHRFEVFLPHDDSECTLTLGNATINSSRLRELAAGAYTKMYEWESGRFTEEGPLETTDTVEFDVDQFATVIMRRSYEGNVLDISNVTLSGMIGVTASSISTPNSYVYITHDITRHLQSISPGYNRTFPISGVIYAGSNGFVHYCLNVRIFRGDSLETISGLTENDFAICIVPETSGGDNIGIKVNTSSGNSLYGRCDTMRVRCILASEIKQIGTYKG